MTVAQQHHWYQSIRHVFSLLSAKEVKTPLSFFFRLSSLVVGLVLLGVFVVPVNDRVDLFAGAGILVALLAVIVAGIAWNRPKNLVYGESGYRAETRLSLGTEKEQIDADRLAVLPRTSNPNATDIVVAKGED